MSTRWLDIAVCLVSVLWVLPLRAQVLHGDWVDQSQQQIAAHRMVDLRVIVLDRQGKPVADAPVHIQQLRHAFVFGMDLDPAALERDGQIVWPDTDAPVWRCFNAVSLDTAGDWSRVQPQAGKWDFDTVDAVLTWCRTHGMTVRWGGLISADPDRLPPWVLEADDAALREAIDTYLLRVVGGYHEFIDEFDLHTHLLDRNIVTARLGQAMLSRMYEQTHVIAPKAVLFARFENALTGSRFAQMTTRITELRESFVPIDAVALDETIQTSLVQAPLARATDRLSEMNIPVLIARLEVGGSSDTAAALNLETILRTFFASPAIEGIYLSGVTHELGPLPASALMNRHGEPTRAGLVLDGLVRKLWWTDVEKKTDPLGNVRVRAFAGTYRLTAAMPDGSQLEMHVQLPAADGQRVVLLQPLTVAIDQGGGGE